MDKAIAITISFILGFLLGTCCMSVISNKIYKAYENDVYRVPMKALGIEKFQYCEINTTNCHSNWYEIIYMKSK